MAEYIKLRRRIVYRGDVYAAIEGERLKVLPKVFDREYTYGVHDGLKKALSILTNDVEDVPAADVEKERHGRWIIDRGLYKCSACSRLWSELWWAEIVPLEKMLKLMPYCPNCGAQMDMEEEDK